MTVVMGHPHARALRMMLGLVAAIGCGRGSLPTGAPPDGGAPGADARTVPAADGALPVDAPASSPDAGLVVRPPPPPDASVVQPPPPPLPDARVAGLVELQVRPSYVSVYTDESVYISVYGAFDDG